MVYSVLKYLDVMKMNGLNIGQQLEIIFLLIDTSKHAIEIALEKLRNLTRKILFFDS